MSHDAVEVDPCLSWARSTSSLSYATTIREAIFRNVNRQSDKIALISDHEDICKSFKQLFDDCCNLAENLVTVCGLKHGDHVAISTGNCYNYFVSLLACAIKGIITWPYDPNMSANEVKRYIETVKPSAIFTMGLGSLQHDLFPNMADIIAELHGIGVAVIAIDGERYDLESSYHLNSLLVKNRDDDSHGQLTAADDPLLVFVSSGSTGAPKMIMWSNQSLIAAQHTWYTNIDFQDGDKLCLPLSVHHAFAPAILKSLLFYSHQIILTGYKYSLSQTVACLKKYDCNIIALVSTMLHDILKNVAKNQVKLKLTKLVISSATLTKSMGAWVGAIFPGSVCHQFYGLSEMGCSGIVTRCRFDTVGKPLGDCQVKIVDDDGNMVPHDVVGRLLIKTKYAMMGYLKQNGVIDDSVFDEDGYFESGDLFSIDSEGYLYYQGRSKDLINRAGFKISPKEVENVILSVPGIIDCVVLGVPDKRLGEEIAAAVCTDGATGLLAEDLKALISEKISRSKMPRKFYISNDPIPRLSNQKYDKQTLRRQLTRLCH